MGVPSATATTGKPPAGETEQSAESRLETEVKQCEAGDFSHCESAYQLALDGAQSRLRELTGKLTTTPNGNLRLFRREIDQLRKQIAALKAARALAEEIKTAKAESKPSTELPLELDIDDEKVRPAEARVEATRAELPTPPAKDLIEDDI